MRRKRYTRSLRCVSCDGDYLGFPLDLTSAPLQWYEPPKLHPQSKHQVREIDFALDNLYLKRDYAGALLLAMAQLEVEKDNDGKEGRTYQLVDMAMRCATKRGKSDLAGRLADGTREKVCFPPAIEMKFLVQVAFSGSACLGWR